MSNFLSLARHLMLTHADFLAGLGVFSLAARELLIERKLLCESNDFCQTTLEKNFPGIRIHADMINSTVSTDCSLPITETVLMVNSTVSTDRSLPIIETVLTVNSTISNQTEESAETVLMVNSTVSTDRSLPITETVLTVNNSTYSSKRRSRGKGTGRIQWRTITKKNGKQYQQAWYDWQLRVGEKVISKSTYIAKDLLPQVQHLEADKAPVRKILQVLGVKL